MMRVILILIFALGFFFIPQLQAGANGSSLQFSAPSLTGGTPPPGIFAPAAVVKTGAVVVGVEPMLYFEGPKKLGILGHIRYGLMPQFEINGALGINRGELYFRGGIDYQAVYDKKGSVGLLVRAGGFMNSDGMGSGLDLGAMVGNQFKLVNIYGGLDIKFVVDPVDYTILNLVGGIHIPFQRKTAFVGEIGLNVNDKQASYLSGGVLFYF